jgi:CheY-like chemotaxis protein
MSVNPVLAEEIAHQLRMLGLDAHVTGRLDWAPSKDDAREAGLIALVDHGEVGSGYDEEIPSGAPVVRLLRSAGNIGRSTHDPRHAVTAKLPLTPRSLYRALAQAAGLELASAPAARAAQTHLPAARQATAPILLVEDSEANRQVAVAILSKAGYQVEIAANGRLAVAAVMNGTFGLVLMDLAMPELDGLEATRLIRNLDGDRARVPIVAMTASTFPQDRELCLEAGMNGFLTKPVVRRELLDTAERWLEGSRTPTHRDGTCLPSSTLSLLSLEVLDDLRKDVTDELLPEMIRTFLAEARRRVDRIRTAAAQDDVATVSAESHALTSATGVFGALALQEEARAMEHAGLTGSADGVREALPTLLTVAQATFELLEQRLG